MLASTCKLHQFCFCLFWRDLQVLLDQLFLALDLGQFLLLQLLSLFQKCCLQKYSWLIKLSNSFLTFNQLATFGVGIKDGPLVRTDFCWVVNIFNDILIAFWSGPSSLAFLIFSFRLSFTPFLFPLFFFIRCFLVNHRFCLLSLLLFSTQRLTRAIFRWCLRLVLFSIIWTLRLIFVLILRCSSWLYVSGIFILIRLRCCHSLWSSILTVFVILISKFIILLWEFIILL